MKKGVKLILIFGLILFLVVMLLIFNNSTDFFEKIKEITGMATQTVILNISVGGPQITNIWNYTLTGLVSSGPNEAPAFSSATVNFTAYSAAGAANINYSTAKVNITASESDVRTNSSCTYTESAGNYGNVTCNITMWWWDKSGTWNITAFVLDNQTNVAQNTTTTFSVGQRTSFAIGPATLSWSGISPGSTNQTSSNDPLVLNNTGNDVIDSPNLEINASNLSGETNQAYALHSKNFSVSWTTGGSCTGDACTECAGTQMMSNMSYVGVASANLSRGNFTINDGDTGQEELYFCLRIAGSELITQAYSTKNTYNWIVRTS